MYGLDSISANNGWAISFLGITIVFIGLTLLSLIISQLHKLLDIWENRTKTGKNAFVEDTAHPAVTEAEEKLQLEQLPCDQQAVVCQFKLLVDRLGTPISLPELLNYAQRVGMESPHSNLDDLLRKKVIVPDGKGFFNWNIQ